MITLTAQEREQADWLDASVGPDALKALFDMDGDPVTFGECCALHERRIKAGAGFGQTYGVIARDVITDTWWSVTTQWLGCEQINIPGVAPRLFHTVLTNELSGAQTTYATYANADEALSGHQYVCQEVGRGTAVMD